MLANVIQRRVCPVLVALAWAAPLPAQPSVSGTVLGPSGQPFTGAQVELVPALSNFEAGRLRLAGGSGQAAAATGRSDADGRYHLRAPAAGAFRVVVRSPGQVPMQHASFLLAEDRELPPVVLMLDAGARLRVEDPSGRPVAGVWMFATGAEEREATGRVADWRTDFRVGRTGADGSTTFPRWTGERLDVSVFLPGGAEETRREIEGGTIAIGSGEVVARGLRVVTPRGEPLAGVLIRAGDLSWPIGLTDSEGRLRIPCEAGHEGRIRLVAPEGRQKVVEVPVSSPGDGELVVVLADAVAVSGRVLDQASSRPIAGALVSPSVDPGAFVRTDEAGRYRLVAPEAEGFQLQAAAPDHLDKAAGVTGAHVRSARAPALGLEPAAAVHGQVVDSRGVPLSGTGVFAVPEPRPDQPPGSRDAVDRGATDSGGRFELRRLRPGAGYELQVSRPGFLSASVRAVAPRLSQSAPPLKVFLSPVRAARGWIKDAAGRPVAGAEVLLIPARKPGSRPQPPDEAGGAARENSFLGRSDEHGRFSIPRIPAPELDLTASKRGYASASVRNLRIPEGNGPAELGTVVLAPGARLQGRVVDSQGRAVPGAEVRRTDNPGRGEADAVTVAGGRFVLEDLPKGRPVDLVVSASGYLPARLRGVRAPTREPLSIRLKSGELLRGRVADEVGNPVDGARIEVTSEPTFSVEKKEIGEPVSRYAVTDLQGRFEVRDLPAGTLDLAVTARGFVPVEDLEVPVPRLESTGELTVTLERGALLEGHISTTAGAPVSGTRISAQGAAAVSDDEGAYLLEGVAPGQITVSVFHPHYKRLSKRMVIAPGANTLDVTFKEGLEVTGRVVDPEAMPVPGAMVSLQSEGGGARLEYRERAAADGTFRLFPVARGRYRLRASQEGYSLAELQKPVIVADEPVAGLDIVLERGGAIVGQILGLSADELAQVQVEARSDAGEIFPARVDPAGQYEVRQLRPGDFLVRAYLPAKQRQVQARVPLGTGQSEVRCDLEFGHRLTLSGQVLYGEDPLPETLVSIRGQHLAIERSVTTDYQGGFRLEDLDPDSYALGVSHPRKLLVHSETVELTGDREIVIRLRTATVSGVVLDGKSGRPVASALVMLRHTEGGEGAEFLITDGTHQDGSFDLFNVPAGNYQLATRAEGYAPAEQQITVPAGQDMAGLEISLQPTRGLQIAVRLASGGVPGAVHVRALGPSGAVALADTLSPDREGALPLSTLPDGNWTLLLSVAGGAAVTVPVVVPGEPTTITLPDPSRLRVRIAALASSDLLATLTLRGGDQQTFWALGFGGAIQDRWQLVAGKGSIEGLPAGLWHLEVVAPDGRLWTGVVATSGQPDSEVTLK